ncbi:trypsin-like peptidase domain-containing protein [Aestuariivirga sp.]|uniref:nSTAND1 domain-containing NTPase n=1 Tax=Aestuariivirga sp. TaxID=2650926 RepID=UPI0035932404
MTVHFTGPVARILRSDGEVCGTGFLVGGRHVLTCAHVIDDALKRSRGTAQCPAEEIALDLPFLGRTGLKGRVVAWYPMRDPATLIADPLADIAVLELAAEADVSGVSVPAKVDRRRQAAGASFVSYGFPVGLDNGTVADGEVLIEDPGGWLQVRGIGDHGYFIERGFSGAPVFSPGGNRLIGMATQADRDEARRLAFVLPAQLLCRAWPALAQPYRGLAAFKEEDADLLCGRADFVKELRAKLDRYPFTVVVGPSGSGKSSVVMAGLAPQLRREGWRIATCRPGRDAIYDLAYGLAPLLGAGSDDFAARNARAEEWAKRLREDPGRILELASGIARSHGEDSGYTLLIIDQFEQLFTDDVTAPDGAVAKPDEVTPDHGSPRQKAFLKVLETIGSQDASRPLAIRAVATLRADFMSPALKIGALVKLLRDADVKLGPMGASELTAAIREPAKLFGVGFEDGLVEEIVASMKGRPGGLPLLQFALDRLWRRQKDRLLTWQAYRGPNGRGGLETALDDHAETVLESLRRNRDLGSDIEKRLRRVMLRLVHVGENAEATPDARAVALRNDFRPEDWTLVQRLADERLVMIGQSPSRGEETAEVVHEALIGSWQRLRDWIAEDRLFKLWQQRLKVDLERWSDKPEDALLQGRVLAEAAGWLSSHRDELNAREVAFIEASRDNATCEAEEEVRKAKEREELANKLAEESQKLAEERQRAFDLSSLAQTGLRLRNRLLMAALGVVFLALAAAGYGYFESTRQARVATINESHALAAAADAMLLNHRPVQALKLALASWPRNEADSRPRLPGALTTISRTISSERLPARLLRYDNWVNGALAMPDGRILSWTEDQTLRLWDVNTGLQSGPAMEHDDVVTGALVTPDDRILSWSDDQTLRLWDASTGLQIGTGMKHEGPVSGALLMPDGRILSRSGDQTLRLWDAETGLQSGPAMEHDDVVTGALVLPDGRILSWSMDDTLRLWDSGNGLQSVPTMKHASSVHGALVMPDGRILSWSDDQTLRLWDASTGLQIGTAMKHEGPVSGVLLMPDSRILSWSEDQTLRLWDSTTGLESRPAMKHDDVVTGALVTPDGRILSWSDDQTLRLWDPTTSLQSGAPMKHDGPVYDALVMPDGRILSSSHDQTLRLWDATTGLQSGPTMKHDSLVQGALEMPDSRILFTLADATMRLWDATTGLQSGPAMKHDSSIQGALKMPDGRILSWSDDQTLRLWDAETGLQSVNAMRHDSFVRGALYQSALISTREPSP